MAQARVLSPAAACRGETTAVAPAFAPNSISARGAGHRCAGFARSHNAELALGLRRPDALNPWEENSLKRFAPLPRRAEATEKSEGRGRSRVGIRALQLDVNYVDEQKAKAFPYRRSVFTFDDWKKHRSSGRHLRHITTMLGSRVIGSLGPPVVAMTAIASFVVAWNELLVFHVLPESFPVLHSNPLPFSLTAPALSFLLVFRTNSSYGRFDEARKMWGLMLNRTRDICRQALSYMARDQNAGDRPKMEQFLRHLQAFPLTYKHHFLQEGSLEEDLRNFTSLTDDEVKAVLESTHRPNYTLQMMSECMARCQMDSIQRFSMDTNMTTFADDIGGSERIFKTPIPLSYTRLTSRFMVLWHAFLPLALWDSCNWATIPVTFLTAAAFFCIEEVGVLIEEPFSILALDVIAQSARNNVAELIKLHDGIKARVVPNLQIAPLKTSTSESSSNGSTAAPSPPQIPAPTASVSLPDVSLDNSDTCMRT